jgi:hypothetical protein
VRLLDKSEQETPFFKRIVPLARAKGGALEPHPPAPPGEPNNGYRQTSPFEPRQEPGGARRDAKAGNGYRQASPFEQGATHIQEITKWNWNFAGKSEAGADVILSINGYTRPRRVSEDQPAKMSFSYAIHRCISYDVGPFTLGDALDVDDGEYLAVYQDRTLTVTASKSIHFQAPTPNARDEIVLLNLLSPAVTSMLIRELVLDGTSRALENPQAITASH